MIGHDLTIAIVSYRTPKLADDCAASINTGELRARTVIVETGDCTATPPASARRFFMPGLGYAAALQRIFDAADSPFLVAVNADVRFPASSIEPLIDLFSVHPRLAVIGPRQVTPDHTRIAHAGVLEAGSPNGGRDFGQPNVGQYMEPLVFVAQVSGSVMILRSQAFREVGGMNRMPHLYFEDSLLCHRLRHAGWDIGYSGLLTFTHHVSASPQPPEGRAHLAQLARAQWDRELTAA